MASELREHHQNWLLRHPERSEEWLRERLRDGFDVHHLDGDHANNAGENLVLIEHGDHMRLHDLRFDMVKALAARRTRALADQEDASVIYELRRSGVCFSEIDKLTYVRGSNARKRMLRANVLAYRHAKQSDLPFETAWNIPGLNPERARLRKTSIR